MLQVCSRRKPLKYKDRLQTSNAFGELRCIFRREVAGRKTNENFAFFADFGFPAARHKELKNSEAAGGKDGSELGGLGEAHPFNLRTRLAAVEPNCPHNDGSLNHRLVVGRNAQQVQAVVDLPDEQNP